MSSRDEKIGPFRITWTDMEGSRINIEFRNRIVVIKESGFPTGEFGTDADTHILFDNFSIAIYKDKK